MCAFRRDAYHILAFTIDYAIGPSSQPHTSLYPWSWLRYNSYDPPMDQRSQAEFVLNHPILTQDRPLTPSIGRSCGVQRYYKIHQQSHTTRQWLRMIRASSNGCLMSISLGFATSPVYPRRQKPQNNYHNGLALSERRNV